MVRISGKAGIFEEGCGFWLKKLKKKVCRLVEKELGTDLSGSDFVFRGEVIRCCCGKYSSTIHHNNRSI